jgi:hypothetical protein
LSKLTFYANIDINPICIQVYPSILLVMMLIMLMHSHEHSIVSLDYTRPKLFALNGQDGCQLDQEYLTGNRQDLDFDLTSGINLSTSLILFIYLIFFES